MNAIALDNRSIFKKPFSQYRDIIGEVVNTIKQKRPENEQSNGSEKQKEASIVTKSSQVKVVKFAEFNDEVKENNSKHS